MELQVICEDSYGSNLLLSYETSATQISPMRHTNITHLEAHVTVICEGSYGSNLSLSCEISVTQISTTWKHLSLYVTMSRVVEKWMPHSQ
eukprot:scaffold214191_cov15-Tisochrysis_lutea.AAC.1